MYVKNLCIYERRGYIFAKNYMYIYKKYIPTPLKNIPPPLKNRILSREHFNCTDLYE